MSDPTRFASDLAPSGPVPAPAGHTSAINPGRPIFCGGAAVYELTRLRDGSSAFVRRRYRCDNPPEAIRDESGAVRGYAALCSRCCEVERQHAEAERARQIAARGATLVPASPPSKRGDLR